MKKREGLVFERYASHEDMRRAQIEYWQSRPADERFFETWRHSVDMWKMKNPEYDGRRFERTAVYFERP
mgnify:FL=1